MTFTYDQLMQCEDHCADEAILDLIARIKHLIRTAGNGQAAHSHPDQITEIRLLSARLAREMASAGISDVTRV